MRLTAQGMSEFEGWSGKQGSQGGGNCSPLSQACSFPFLNQQQLLSLLCPIPTKSCSIRHTHHTNNSSQEGDLLVPGAHCRY